MELRPPGTPIDDPFFEAVRVGTPTSTSSLSRPTTPRSRLTPVDDATVARVTELVVEAAADLWSAVAPASVTAPTTQVRFADRETDVRADARVVESTRDGYALLVRLRHDRAARLAGAAGAGRAGAAGGRAARWPAPGVVRRGLGALLLDLSSAALPVGVERARELVR